MLHFDKFTVKNQEAIQKAIELAQEFGHQQIDPEHLTLALIKEDGSIFSVLLERLGISSGDLLSKLKEEFRKKPAVEGAESGHLSSFLNN